MLDVLVTRKIGHPRNREVAIGSVMPDGQALGDPELLEKLGISEEQFQAMAHREQGEIERRLTLYTGSIRTPSIEGRTVIIIDDGIATGYTVRAAVQWLQKLKAAHIIVAVPVAPADVVADLREEVEVICPIQADDFMAVGMYYDDFGDTTDHEVIALLKSNTTEQHHKKSCLPQDLPIISGECAGAGDWP